MTNDKNFLETVYIKDEISKCEDIEDVKEIIFPMLSSQQTQWSNKINAIIKESGDNKSKFAKLCGVSRVSVDKWCKGAIPKNRETFIRIGLAAGYDEEKINQLLVRYGRYSELYSKSLEDCICLFVISHFKGEEAVDKYLYILDKIKGNIIRDEKVLSSEDINTVVLKKELEKVQNEEELEKFIFENIGIFSNAFHKFYSYVKMNIEINYMDSNFVNSVYEMSAIQEWSSSLKQCVSAIRQNKWYPTRNKIISLGLHLSMDHEQIDEMLSLAHMEPLCAKNIFESVIMFILDDASLNDVLNAEADGYDPDELCRYARKVLSELDMPEILDFISELPEEENE